MRKRFCFRMTLISRSYMIHHLQGHQYETVSGFICEAFGYIPRTGESIKVVLEKENEEEADEYTEAEIERQEEKQKHQVFKLEVDFIYFPVLPACRSLEVPL